MSRVVALIAVLTVFVVAIVALITVLNYEALNRIAAGIIGAGGALLGQAILRTAKKTIFGGWTVQIVIDGEIIEEEKENLNTADAEIIIEYNRPWWIVVLMAGTWFAGIPHVRKDLSSEQLLRQCCDSQGRVNCDVRNFASVDARQRIITLNLKKCQIR